MICTPKVSNFWGAYQYAVPFLVCVRKGTHHLTACGQHHFVRYTNIIVCLRPQNDVAMPMMRYFVSMMFCLRQKWGIVFDVENNYWYRKRPDGLLIRRPPTKSNGGKQKGSTPFGVRSRTSWHWYTSIFILSIAIKSILWYIHFNNCQKKGL